MAKTRANKPPMPPPDERERIDLRAEPEFVARARKQAKRRGLSLSAYIRQAVLERIESDERTDPSN